MGEAKSMSEDFFEEFFKKLERRMREIENAIRRDIEETLKFIGRDEHGPRPYSDTVEPLYSIRDLGDRLVIHIDLPFAEEGKVNVWFEGNKMYLRAEIAKKLHRKDLYESYRGVDLREYRLVITLPFAPRPEDTNIRVKKGVLEVVIYKR